MSRLLRLAVAAGVLFAPVVSQGQAPATPPNPWIQVATVSVRPGSVSEYEDALKKLRAGAAKVAASQQVRAYQMAFGGSTYTYFHVTPFDSWRDADAHLTTPEILTKAYGDMEAARLLKLLRGAVESRHTEVFRVLLNLSTNVKLPFAPKKYVSVLRSDLHAGAAPAYMRYLAKIKSAEEKDPASPMVIREGLAYGEGAAVLAVRFSDTMGERAAWPNQAEVLRKAYGEEEAREMTEVGVRSVAKRTQYVLVYRPDLSSPSTGAAATAMR